MTYRFISCNGLGGAGELGFVQMGFKLMHRCGTLDLGAKNVRANRHIMGWDWEDEFSDDPNDWDVPKGIDVIYGNPPCSGFSTFSRKDFRGKDSKANDHMKALVAYMGRVKPTIGAFESVQQAYTGGCGFMRELRDKLEAEAGVEYTLYHVLHNNLTLGGAAQRKRYFWVVSQVPFGLDPPIPVMVPTLMESIGDLQGLQNTWEKQPYVYPETWWSSRRRAPDGAVDGHARRILTHAKRVQALVDALDGEWPQGWREQDAVKAVYERYGRLPPEWSTQEARLVAADFNMGISQMVRWRGDKPARVLTGGALDQAMHPTENRLFTLREAMRIQGFPDNWRLWPLRGVASMGRVPGKGVPVDAGRWLAHWVKQALDGSPGSMRGISSGDREYVFNSTHNYRLVTPRMGRKIYA